MRAWVCLCEGGKGEGLRAVVFVNFLHRVGCASDGYGLEGGVWRWCLFGPFRWCGWAQQVVAIHVCELMSLTCV